jgi:hypothetical protein
LKVPRSKAIPKAKQVRLKRGTGSHRRLGLKLAPRAIIKTKSGTSVKTKFTTCKITAATGKIALGTKTFRMMGPFLTTLSRPLEVPKEKRFHPSRAVTT